MPVRSSKAKWEGNLKEGKGSMEVGDTSFEGGYSFGSRFQENGGTNPEELIGAAHAGCFSMSLSNLLDQAGYEPRSVDTTAEVHLETVDDSPKITRIVLNTNASVADIDDGEFQEIANSAKENCPVSKLVKGADIELNAQLT